MDTKSSSLWRRQWWAGSRSDGKPSRRVDSESLCARAACRCSAGTHHGSARKDCNLIKSHRWRLRTYDNVFTGTDLVEWLVNEKFAQMRSMPSSLRKSCSLTRDIATMCTTTTSLKMKAYSTDSLKTNRRRTRARWRRAREQYLASKAREKCWRPCITAAYRTQWLDLADGAR